MKWLPTNAYNAKRIFFWISFYLSNVFVSSSPTQCFYVFELFAKWNSKINFSYYQKIFIHHSLFTLMKWQNWYWTTQKHKKYMIHIHSVNVNADTIILVSLLIQWGLAFGCLATENRNQIFFSYKLKKGIISFQLL